MKSITIHRIPDIDYAWVSERAAQEGTTEAAYIKTLLHDLRLGYMVPIQQASSIPTPKETVSVTLPAGAVGADILMSPVGGNGVVHEGDAIEVLLEEADKSGKTGVKVAALQKMYDTLFPEDGRYRFERLARRRAEDWLRAVDSRSAVEVYEILIDGAWSRRDEDGNYLDHERKVLDNPATYASASLEYYKKKREASPNQASSDDNDSWYGSAEGEEFLKSYNEYAQQYIASKEDKNE